MTVPEPELADGALDARPRPLPAVPDAELPDVPVLLPAELPEAAGAELAEVACCAPGSANATAAAAITLAMPAAAVTERSRARPRSRSATARLVSCECLLIGRSLPGLVLHTASLAVLGRAYGLPLSQL